LTFSTNIKYIFQGIEKVLYPEFVTKSEEAIAGAKSCAQSALTSAKEFYRSEMQGLFASKDHFAQHDFLAHHKQIKSEAVTHFKQQPGNAAEDIYTPFLINLEKVL